MAKYKITDIEALEKEYPNAVIVSRMPNRALIGKMVRAAVLLGHTLPGVEIASESDTLADVPAHFNKKD